MDDKKSMDTVLEKAASFLQKGELVAFPTETVYGLGADATMAEAAKKIYAAKGRPSDNPLIVHIADIKDLKEVVKEIPVNAERLAKAFWPGPLTMILEKSDKIPYETTGGLDTVAVRMPSHPLARAVIQASGRPIAAPSANASGRPSPTLASHVQQDLDGKIAMIIDGGAVEIGIESTIIDLTVEPPMILRPGAVTRAMLQKEIGEVREDPGLEQSSNVRPKAPGMKYRHYAPKAELIIVKGNQDNVISTINKKIHQLTSEGRLCGVIAANETIGSYKTVRKKSIGSKTDEASIAHNLYAILREFDEMDVAVIYSEDFDTPTIGTAIMNRLLKAAGHRVIDADKTL